MGTGRSGWGVVTRDSGHAGQQLGPTGGGQLPHWGAKRFLSSVSFPLLPRPGGFACRRCEQSASGFMFTSLCVHERKKKRTIFNPMRGFLRIEAQVLWLG